MLLSAPLRVNALAALLSTVTPIASLAPVGVTAQAVFANNAQGDAVISGPDSAISSSDWASARKLMMAMVVWDHKGAVWDTELVTYQSADATGIAAVWTSPLADGEQVYWSDLVTMMLVPSFTDVAGTISRVLGGELNAVDSLSTDADSRFSLEVSNLIASLGMADTVFFGATPEIADPTMSSTPEDMVKQARAGVAYAGLLPILQTGIATISVQTPTPRTFDVANTNLFVNGIGTSPNNVFWTGHVGGKTGSEGNSNKAWSFVHTMPNGEDLAYAMLGSGGELERFRDAVQLLMHTVDENPGYSPAAPDPHLSNVSAIVGQTSDPLAVFPAVAATSTSAPAVLTRAGKLWETVYAFDGSSQYLDLGDPAGLNMDADDFTVELFLRGNGANTDTANFLSKYWPSSGGRSYQFRYDGGQIQGWASTSGNSATLASFGIAASDLFASGARFHLCFQRFGSTCAVFVDGSKGGTVANIGTGALNTTSNRCFVGCRGRSTPEGQFAPFTLDEMRITKGVARYNHDGFAVPLSLFGRA